MFSTCTNNSILISSKSLYAKIKSSKSKYISLDQTIEEACDESQFEEKLDEFIWRTARFEYSVKSPRLNNYYTSASITDSLAAQHKPQINEHFDKDKNEWLNSQEIHFLEHAFSLIKFSMMDEMYGKFKEDTEEFFDKLTDVIRHTHRPSTKLVASKKALSGKCDTMRPTIDIDKLFFIMIGN